MKVSNLGAGISLATLFFLGLGVYFLKATKKIKKVVFDQIDKDFKQAIKDLPKTGTILDSNKKINLDNLLLFQKAYFNHMKQREFDNYYRFKD